MASKVTPQMVQQAVEQIKARKKREAALPSPVSVTLPKASELKDGGFTLPTGKEILLMASQLKNGGITLPAGTQIAKTAEKAKETSAALPPSRLENAVVKGAAMGVGKALEQKQKELSYEILEKKYPSPIPQKEGQRSAYTPAELAGQRLAASKAADRMKSAVQRAEENDFHLDLAEEKSALEKTAFGKRNFASAVNAARAQAGAMSLREAQERIFSDEADSPRKVYRDLLAKLRLEAEGGGLASARVGKSDFYTEDEKKIILYYGSIGDFDTLSSYLDTLRYRVNESSAAQEAKDLASFIDEQGAVGKAIGAGVNVMSGLTSGKGLVENVSAAIDGRPIDPNAEAYAGVRAGETSAEALTKDLSPTASFFVNAGLSLANMGANMALLGPGAIYNMAASSAASTSYEVKKRGGSDAQANALAAVSGLATALLEKLPIDEIFRAGRAGAAGVKTTLKSALLGVLKSGGSEGAEELAEEMVNRLADSIVMGDRSEIELYKRELTANGYSAEQAEKMAFYEFCLKAPLLSFAAGALSGGILRGGAEIGSAMQYRDLHQNADTVDKAVQEAVTSMDGTKTAETKNTAEGGVKYSIGETEDGRSVAIVDSDILAEIDTSSWDKEKKEAAKKAASEALKKYKDGIVVSGIRHKVNRDSRREYTRSNDTERLYRRNKEAFADKMRAADIASDVVIAATNWKQDGGLTHPREDRFVDFMHGDTLIASGKNKYQAVVAIGITEKGESVFYDVVSMEPIDFVIKKEESSTTATTQNAIGDIHEDSTTNSISQTSEKSSENAKVFSFNDELDLDASFDEGERVRVKADDAVRILPTLYSERVVSSGGQIGVSPKEIAMVKRAADKLKRRLMFYEGEENEQGYYDSRTRTIYLNKNGSAPLLQTFAHELVHSAEMTEEYKELSDYVFLRMEEQGISRESLRSAKKDLYARAKRLTLSDADADAEIVAEYLAKNLLGSESALNELAARNRSVLLRLYHALKRFFAKIGIAKEQTREEEILSVFEKALRESTKAKKNAASGGMTAKYDLNNTLGQQLNDWLQGNGKANGSYNGRYFELGTTPSVLIKHGAPSAPFIMYEECILKVTGGKHSISLDEIARLPEQLNDPILLFKGSVPNSFVALTELTDKYRNDVVVAIHVNKRHDRNVINRIASLYSKSDEFGNNRIKSYVKAQIESGNLLDASKEKAPIWFTSRGLQLPKLVQTIIDADISIPEKADSVKRQFSLAEDAGADAVTADGFPTEGEPWLEEKVFPIDEAVSRFPEGARDTARHEINRQRRIFAQDVFKIRDERRKVILDRGIAEMMNEYMENDRISDKLKNEVFQETFEATFRDAQEYVYRYGELSGWFKRFYLLVDEETKSKFGEKWRTFAKGADNLLWLVSADSRSREEAVGRASTPTLRIGEAYIRLGKHYPELFPQRVTDNAERLKQIRKIASTLERAARVLDVSRQAEFETFSRHEFEIAVENYTSRLRDLKAYAKEAEEKAWAEQAAQSEKRLAKLERVKRKLEREAKASQDINILTDVVNRERNQRKRKVAAHNKEEKDAYKSMVPQTVNEAVELGRSMKKLSDTVHYTEERWKDQTSEEDLKIVEGLLSGILLPDEIPKGANHNAIVAIYNARAQYERSARAFEEWRENNKKRLHEEAEAVLGDVSRWEKDKLYLSYNLETMQRNVLDIAPDRETAKRVNDAYFHPVQEHEAMVTRLKNEMRSRVREMKLSEKIAEGNETTESTMVQYIGERTEDLQKESDPERKKEIQAEIDEAWEKNPNMDQKKIYDAVATFRKIYDELYHMANEVRVAAGYEPIPYRKGYFPHVSDRDGDPILAKIVGALDYTDSLPTELAGRTKYFKPGARWSPHFQARGSKPNSRTVVSALYGFESYIEFIPDFIYHTADIQKLRALAEKIRWYSSDEGRAEQLDAFEKKLKEGEKLSEEDIEKEKKKFDRKARVRLSGFVQALDEYTNILAGKKSDYDRSAEKNLGRSIAYNLFAIIQKQYARNAVSLNSASWLNNLIPLAQAQAEIGPIRMLTAMQQTLRGYWEKDKRFLYESDFLTNRRGSERLLQTRLDKISANLSVVGTVIDHFVAESLVRGKFRRAKESGMSDTEAMKQADRWTASVMADRSKGSMPAIFHAKNPLIKIFTSFMIEPNNELRHFFKDLPREYDRKKLFVVVLRSVIGAWLINELFEWLFGRRVAFDPLDYINETVGDLTGYELPSIADVIREIDSEKGLKENLEAELALLETDKKKPSEVLMNFGKRTLETLPFVGGPLGSGRVPISSALPDFETLFKTWDALEKPEDPDSEEAKTYKVRNAKRQQYLAYSALAPMISYLVLPFGGGQLKKVGEFAVAFARGGSYSVDSQGRDVLQYPVYGDSGKDKAGSLVRGLLFGKSSLPEAVDWVESSFDSLSAKQTAAYQAMSESDGQRKAFEAVSAIAGIERGNGVSSTDRKRRYIMKSDLSKEGRAELYFGFVATDKETEVYDRLAVCGVSRVDAYKTLVKFGGLDQLYDSITAEKKLALIDESGLEDDAKLILYRDMVASKTAKERLSDLEYYGLTDGEIYEIMCDLERSTPSEDRAILAKAEKMSEAQKVEQMEDLYSEKGAEKLKKAAAAGIETRVFNELWNYRYSDDKKLKKDDVLKKIDRCRLTRSQKDLMYDLLGFGESTKDEAPWNSGRSSAASSGLYKGASTSKSLYKESTAQKSLYKTK